MNLNEAKAKMDPNAEYKFVGTLVPPMLAIARIIDSPPSHVNMGKQLGLVVFDPNLPTKPPYRPIDEANFRAGSVQLENGSIVLTNESDAFLQYMPTEKEFASILQGDITLLNTK